MADGPKENKRGKEKNLNTAAPEDWAKLSLEKERENTSVDQDAPNLEKGNK